MADKIGEGGIVYRKAEAGYFEKRGFRRYAGVWSLWALGVGAVISGHYSGWNLGLATGGWGGMLVAGIIIMIMYLGLVFCIAEMAPALPHTGAAYSFARSAMGPWGGFITGLCENVEYVLTPAVIVFFIGSYMGAIFETPPEFQPVWWVLMYALFLALNIVGVELSFKVTLVVTLAALAVLIIFWVSAFPHLDFSRWALNIAPDGTELPEGNGPWFPFGIHGVLATLPFAVWLFLAIEQLPLAAEEFDRSQARYASGHPAWHVHADHLSRHDRMAQSVGDRRRLVCARQVGRAAARWLPRHLWLERGEDPRFRRGDRFDRELPHHHLCQGPANLLAVASRLFSNAAIDNAWRLQDTACRHDRRCAGRFGSDVHCLVRRGLGEGFRDHRWHSSKHGRIRRHVLLHPSGDIVHNASPQLAQHRAALSESAGIPGATATIIIGLVTVYYQLSDPVYRIGVIAVACWFVLGVIYFALFARHRMILSPEEEFAMEHKKNS